MWWETKGEKEDPRQGVPQRGGSSSQGGEGLEIEATAGQVEVEALSARVYAEVCREFRNMWFGDVELAGDGMLAVT